MIENEMINMKETVCPNCGEYFWGYELTVCPNCRQTTFIN